MCNYMQQINKITNLPRDIVALLCWARPGMPDQTQQILQDLTKAYMDINYMQKMNITPQIVFEILKFKKSCNLICGDHFEKQIFQT